MKKWDKNIMRLLKSVGEKADREGYSAFVVGGVVRDLILNRNNFDLDIVLEADAVLFAQEFSRAYDASLIVYKQFKTATLVLPDGLKLDFATARKEHYPFSASLPVVSAGSIHDDLFRRDFTINAMALSLNKKQFGRLRDDFHGMEDLKRKKIRILHDQSFFDDPTRILRAVRFEQRFDFQIEKKSLDVLKSALKKDAVGSVKPPRYFEEFKKNLSEECPAKSLKRLKDLGGLEFLDIKFKDFSKILKTINRIEQNILWHKKQERPSETLEGWLIYFFALAEDASAGKMKTIGQQFNLKRTDREKMISSKKILTLMKRLDSKTLKPSQIFRMLKPFSPEAILFLKSKAPSPSVIKHIDDFLLKYEPVKLNVDGNDLVHMGIPQGKPVGDILRTILHAKIDGFADTRDEELKIVQDFLRRKPKEFSDR